MVHYYLSVQNLKEREILLDDLSKKMDECCDEIGENKKGIEELEILYKIQRKELMATEQKIAVLKSEIEISALVLKNLVFRKKEIEDVIENSTIVSAILVDDENKYGLFNGLIDLNRDVLMKEIKMIHKEEKIRNVIGMTKIFYEWSKKAIFRWSTKDLCSFRSNPLGNCLVTHTLAGRHCTFTSEDCGVDRTIFLDRSFSSGLFQWAIKIEYSDAIYNDLEIGIVPSDLVEKCDDVYFGKLGGTCGFGCFQSTKYEWGSDSDSESVGADADVNVNVTTGSYLRGVHGVCDKPTDIPVPFSLSTDTFIAHGAIVCVEMNVDARTLCFSVNGKRVRKAISNIEAPVHLGVKGHCSSFTSMSFLRVVSASNSSSASSDLTLAFMHQYYPCISRTDSVDGLDGWWWEKGCWNGC